MSRWQVPSTGVSEEGRLVGGRYLLVARLGSGGFGRVWHARDTALDVDVAVKQLILPPGLPAHERAERVMRARREAANAARLRGNPLASCHAAGIVHRDIKPANVMLSDDGRVVLTDFGISMLTSESGLTATGQFVGSVDYIAPERINADRARPASDLFSLGALLHHAVEGTAPFRRDTAAATIWAVLSQQPAPCACRESHPWLWAAKLRCRWPGRDDH